MSSSAPAPTRRHGVTGTLAAASARRPWLTIGLWLVAIAGAVLAAGGLGDVLTQDAEVLVDIESDRAQDLLDEAFAAQAAHPPTEFVVVEGDGVTVDDPAFADVLSRLSGELTTVEGVTAVIGPDSGAPGLVSADGTIALLQVTLADDDREAADRSAPVVEAVHDVAATAPGFRISTFGEGSVGHEFNELAESTLQSAEIVGLPIALVVLLVVFGAVVAALVPMVVAALAIILAIGLTVGVGQFTDLSFFVVNMITMIGLAVGIDYTLFVVQRYREERLAGRDQLDAITVAGATATRAVVFSGVTVVIALLGMMLMPDTIMRSLGIGAILVVVASLALATTLLPAVLGLLGDRVNALRLPFSSAGRSAEHRFWSGISRRVTRRPVLSMVVAAGLLLLAATPYLGIETGQSFITALPEDSDSRHAFEVMSANFTNGGVQTPVVVTADDVTDPAVTAAVDQLVATLDAEEIYGDIQVTPAPDGTLLLVEATTLIDPSSTEGLAAVETLRGDLIPAAFAGVDAEALVTGQAAFTLDYTELVDGRTPYVFAFVLGLSFVLLLLAFRSIVVPLKAIVMNLLSVGAAYGLMVAVFQNGWGADLLGFQQVDVIETWVPVFLFAVLFGLSMDYHVFLLSRIKERFDQTHDNSSSVAFGLGATGAIITGAALIMVAVFAGFATGDLAMMQQMGFGLGVAVILDATIVRGVLVPATMELLGERNWYFPRWLAWLPKVNIEGHVDPIDLEVIELDEPEPARA